MVARECLEHPRFTGHRFLGLPLFTGIPERPERLNYGNGVFLWKWCRFFGEVTRMEMVYFYGNVDVFFGGVGGVTCLGVWQERRWEGEGRGV